MLRGKFVALNAYLIKLERPQTHNLSSYSKKIEEKENRPKIRRIEEIIKIRAEINEIGKWESNWAKSRKQKAGSWMKQG